MTTTPSSTTVTSTSTSRRARRSVFITDYVYVPAAFALLEQVMMDPEAGWLDSLADHRGRSADHARARQPGVPAQSDGCNVALMPLGPGLEARGPLVAVRAFLPRRREHGVVVPIEWRPAQFESLLPTLEADLELADIDGASSRLGVSGTYKAPLGRLGLRLDRIALGRLAESTLRGFLQALAEVLTATPARPS